MRNCRHRQCRPGPFSTPCFYRACRSFVPAAEPSPPVFVPTRLTKTPGRLPMDGGIITDGRELGLTGERKRMLIYGDHGNIESPRTARSSVQALLSQVESARSGIDRHTA